MTAFSTSLIGGFYLGHPYSSVSRDEKQEAKVVFANTSPERLLCSDCPDASCAPPDQP